MLRTVALSGASFADRRGCRGRYSSQRTFVSERQMNLMAGARWLLALTTRRATQRHGSDPADMGTAFGLDAITTLEPESLGDSPERETAAPNRFELRSRRRSTL